MHSDASWGKCGILSARLPGAKWQDHAPGIDKATCGSRGKKTVAETVAGAGLDGLVWVGDGCA